MTVDFAPFDASHFSLSHQLSFICSPNHRKHNGGPYISEPLILAHIQEESVVFNGTEQIAQFGTGFELWYRAFLVELVDHREMLESISIQAKSNSDGKDDCPKGERQNISLLPIRHHNASDAYHPDHSCSGRFGGTVDKYPNADILLSWCHG